MATSTMSIFLELPGNATGCLKRLEKDGQYVDTPTMALFSVHGIDLTHLAFFCFSIRPESWILPDSWYYIWCHLRRGPKRAEAIRGDV